MNWSDLAALREEGLRPTMPVVICVDERRLAANLHDVGAMTITHEAGEPMPVELLSGLRVWLFVGGCQRGARIVRLLRTKDVRVAELRCWCECFRCFVGLPVDCEVAIGFSEG